MTKRRLKKLPPGLALGANAVPGLRQATQKAIAGEQDAARAVLWANQIGLSLDNLRDMTLGHLADHIHRNTAWDRLEVPSYVIATLAAMAPKEPVVMTPRVESDDPEHAGKNNPSRELHRWIRPDGVVLREELAPLGSELLYDPELARALNAPDIRHEVTPVSTAKLPVGVDTFTARYKVHSPAWFMDAVTGEPVDVLDDTEPATPPAEET